MRVVMKAATIYYLLATGLASLVLSAFSKLGMPDTQLDPCLNFATKGLLAISGLIVYCLMRLLVHLNLI